MSWDGEVLVLVRKSMDVFDVGSILVLARWPAEVGMPVRSCKSSPRMMEGRFKVMIDCALFGFLVDIVRDSLRYLMGLRLDRVV